MKLLVPAGADAVAFGDESWKAVDGCIDVKDARVAQHLIDHAGCKAYEEVIAGFDDLTLAVLPTEQAIAKPIAEPVVEPAEVDLSNEPEFQ